MKTNVHRHSFVEEYELFAEFWVEVALQSMGSVAFSSVREHEMLGKSEILSINLANRIKYYCKKTTLWEVPEVMSYLEAEQECYLRYSNALDGEIDSN